MLGAELVGQNGGRQGPVPNGRGAQGGRSLGQGQVQRVEGHFGRVLVPSLQDRWETEAHGGGEGLAAQMGVSDGRSGLSASSGSPSSFVPQAPRGLSWGLDPLGSDVLHSRGWRGTDQPHRQLCPGRRPDAGGGAQEGCRRVHLPSRYHRLRGVLDALSCISEASGNHRRIRVHRCRLSKLHTPMWKFEERGAWAGYPPPSWVFAAAHTGSTYLHTSLPLV